MRRKRINFLTVNLDMKKDWISCILLVCIFLSCKVIKTNKSLNFPKVEVSVTPIANKSEVWVFIMAGQSNMAGRAFVEPNDTILNNRILTINKNGDLIYAKEPLHYYEPIKTGLDCGLSFGKTLIKSLPNNITILLIPAAIGGSSISQWLGDSTHRGVKLLSNFKEKVAIARKYGDIKGILWHQGETDAYNHESLQYTQRLSLLCSQFRNMIGDTSLPILLGEIGSYSKVKAQWDSVNQSIRAYSKMDARTAIIETSDLKQLGDYEHFTSKSVRILGKRYAKAYQNKFLIY